MEKVETYNSDEKKIIEHGNSLDPERKIKYYEAVINDLYVVHGAFKRDLYMEDNSLRKKLEKEIEKIKKELSSVEQLGAIVKISSKTGITDIVRIFEAMMDAHLISMDTEVTQIANIFFKEKLDAKKFADQYYARKDDIDNYNRNSNSKELVNFVKVLLEKSFNKKGSVLDDIINHIEKIRKN